MQADFQATNWAITHDTAFQEKLFEKTWEEIQNYLKRPETGSQSQELLRNVVETLSYDIESKPFQEALLSGPVTLSDIAQFVENAMRTYQLEQHLRAPEKPENLGEYKDQLLAHMSLIKGFLEDFIGNPETAQFATNIANHFPEHFIAELKSNYAQKKNTEAALDRTTLEQDIADLLASHVPA